MSEYLWAVYALLAAFGGAGLFCVSEYFKQGGTGFLTVIRFLTAIYMLPIVLFVPWPDTPLFYTYAMVPVILIPLADIIYFRISASLGAGVLSRIIPISVLLIFVSWFFLDAELLAAYLKKPYIS